MTNREVLQQMNSEQLSRFLLNPFSTYVPCKYSCISNVYSSECRECIEDWLNTEASEILLILSQKRN